MKALQTLTALLHDRKARILILSALFGLVLVAFGAREAGSKTTDEATDDTTLAFYAHETEERLANVVAGIRGAGKTAVFVTFENTFETVYATNASIDERSENGLTTRNTKKELAGVNDRASGEAPVVVKQLCPKIGGVLIVCEGGGAPSVASEITNAVSTAFGIAKSKIYVTAGAL